MFQTPQDILRALQEMLTVIATPSVDLSAPTTSQHNRERYELEVNEFSAREKIMDLHEKILDLEKIALDNIKNREAIITLHAKLLVLYQAILNCLHERSKILKEETVQRVSIDQARLLKKTFHLWQERAKNTLELKQEWDMVEKCNVFELV